MIEQPAFRVDERVPWLAGRTLRAVHLAWLVLAVGYAALMVLGTPLMLARYQTAVPAASTIAPGQLTSDVAQYLPRVGLSLQHYALLLVVITWLGTVVSWVVGGLLLWKRPGDPVALLFALACLVLPAIGSVHALWHSNPALQLPYQVLEFISDAALILIWSLFPDSRWVPRWTRWVALGAVAYFGVYAFGVFPGPQPEVLLRVTSSVIFPCVLLYVAGLQIYRYRRTSTGAQRQQTKWVLVGLCFQFTVILLTVATCARTRRSTHPSIS